jgi:hypothetical protein
MTTGTVRVTFFEKIPEVDSSSDSDESTSPLKENWLSLDLAYSSFSNEERIAQINEDRNFEAIILSSRFNPVREIGSSVISALVLKRPLLKSINLWGCESLNDRDIDFLAKRSRRLTCVNLTGMSKITDESVEALAQHCSDLSELVLTRCKNITDRSIEALKKYKRHLTLIDVSGCPLISEKGIQTLSEIGDELRRVRLDSCNEAVTDESVENLVSHCPDLEVVDFSHCQRLTSKGVESLARKGKNLRVIDLAGCSSACTEVALFSLLQRCRSLVALNLFSCQLITSQLLFRLVHSGLKALNIAKCNKITNFEPIDRIKSLIYLVIGDFTLPPLPNTSHSQPSSNCEPPFRKIILNHIPPEVIRFSEMTF